MKTIEIDGVKLSKDTVKMALEKAGIQLKPKKDKYEQYIEDNPFKGGTSLDEISIVFFGGRRLVKVPLPMANTRWTLRTFAWVKDFCNEFNRNVYPVHGGYVPDAKNIYIDIPRKEK